MDIVRKELTTNDLFPANLRYDSATDSVQITPDGGTTWLDSPENDPRLKDAYPPLTGASARCDAAHRMQLQLYETWAQIDTAMQAGAATAELAALTVLLLAFIPLIGILTAVIVAIYAQFVAVGYAGVHTAFTGFNWTNIECKLFCLINEDGRLTAAALGQFKDYILATYGSPADTLMNAVLDMLGTGGLNDAAAARTETGDCDACTQCTWQYDIHADDAGLWTWNYHSPYECNGNPTGGAILAGSNPLVNGFLRWLGWVYTGNNVEYFGLNFSLRVPPETTVTRIQFIWAELAGNWDLYINNVDINGTMRCWHGAFMPGSIYDWTGLSYTDTTLSILMRLNGGNGYRRRLETVRVTGTGLNMFL